MKCLINLVVDLCIHKLHASMSAASCNYYVHVCERVCMVCVTLGVCIPVHV